MEEDKIEIGEYVRTKNGIIGKLRGSYLHGKNIEYPEPQEWVIDRFNNKKNYYVISEADIDFDYIVKHSKNIIDLIEVGDYVNGHLVVDRKNDEGRVEIAIESDHIIYYWIEEKDIKSIVTKEQFESRKYEV